MTNAEHSIQDALPTHPDNFWIGLSAHDMASLNVQQGQHVLIQPNLPKPLVSSPGVHEPNTLLVSALAAPTAEPGSVQMSFILRRNLTKRIGETVRLIPRPSVMMLPTITIAPMAYSLPNTHGWYWNFVYPYLQNVGVRPFTQGEVFTASNAVGGMAEFSVVACGGGTSMGVYDPACTTVHEGGPVF